MQNCYHRISIIITIISSSLNTVGNKQQQQTNRRQSFDGSLGEYSTGGRNNNRQLSNNDIPGLPSNGAPYGYDGDYQYMNNNNQGTVS